MNKINESMPRSSSGQSFYNKAFQVKQLDVDHNRTQQPSGDSTDYKNEYRKGEAVSGVAMGSDGVIHRGVIINIDKSSDGTVQGITINDENDDDVAIDIQTIERLDLHNSAPGTVANINTRISECNVMSFDEWQSKVW